MEQNELYKAALLQQNEFYKAALLQIAGHSAFGSNNRGSYYSTSEWAHEIEEAADALLNVAIETGCFRDEETGEPIR